MEQLILVRHGQTDHNVERRLQGRVDIPMNATGEAQAAAVADSLSARDDVVAIYASPLGRARMTAEAIASRLELEVQLDDRLLERSFGRWEGLTRPEIQEQWPDEFANWVGGAQINGMGVETRTDVAARMNAAFRDYHDRHAEGAVIAVSHGAAISLGITATLGLDPETFRSVAGMENCCRAELLPQPHATGDTWVRLASLNIPPDFSTPR